MEYDIGKWLARIIFEPGNYNSLCEYAESDPHLRDHTHNRKVISFDDVSCTVSELNETLRSQIVESYSVSIRSAVETLSSQMMVLSVALLEGMLREFAEAIFIQNPERMGAFCSEGGDSVSLNLKLILNSEDKPAIVRNLAKQSANRLMQGKFDKNLKRLENISKSEVPEPLRTEIARLVVLRNEIVHEARLPSISRDDVNGAYDSLHRLLTWLGGTALEQGVSIDDPAGLLNA